MGEREKDYFYLYMNEGMIHYIYKQIIYMNEFMYVYVYEYK